MINTIWSNRDKHNGATVSVNGQGPQLPGFPLIIANDNAENGILPIVIDLGAIHNLGESSFVEVEALANAIAPGAGASLTVHVAMSSVTYRTPTQLAKAAVGQLFDISGLGASSLLSFLLNGLFNGARYLYIWFDHAALAAGATLELTVRVNTRTEDS